MKQFTLLLLMCLHLLANAQINDIPSESLQQGIQYLKGISKPYDPVKGVALIRLAAFKNYAPAMNALANIYLKGNIAVNTNLDSALFWYDKAINNNYAQSCFNLGLLYKKGTMELKQDFSKAVTYFKKGVLLNNNDCKNALAYMYYKGFGISQSYNSAFILYKETAKNGNANSMYFLGLCYRNGYGTAADLAQAKFWLENAAKNHLVSAEHELNEEPTPENLSVIDLKLQNQLNELQNYNEKYKASSNNNYEGSYSGYAIYYDWSGKYVSEILPLQLKLTKKLDNYDGTWKEGEGEPTSINLNIQGNNFIFNSGNSYTRSNHYSNRAIEEWQFNSAQLQLGFVNDSVLISGNVQFYSKLREEPGKPLKLILKKAITNNTGIQDIGLKLIPNPTNTQTNIQFELTQSTSVIIQISTQTGAIIYTEAARLLPQGKYGYMLQVGRFASGVYNVQIVLNGKQIITKQLIKL